MLRRLSIRDLVVIEAIDLEFGPGLCALTGETGAGKSILIDGLGLALGRRGGADLVRKGARQAVVTAVFAVVRGSTAAEWLNGRGLEDPDIEGEVILRRHVGADGRSRAYINDRPATVTALAELGRHLLELYGQNDRLGLLDVSRHRGALDRFGALAEQAAQVADAHARLAATGQQLAEAEAALAADAAERGLLEGQSEDLTRLAPRPGEEAKLHAERKALMAGERVASALAAAGAALASEPGPERMLGEAARTLRDAAPRAGGRLDELAAAFDRALIETTEASAALDAAAAAPDFDAAHLEAVEARLFTLRAAARKFRVAADDLPALADDIAARLAAIEDSEHGLAPLRAASAAARAAWDEAAARLSAGRRAAATALAADLAKEFAALKLDNARFSVDLTPLAEGAGGAHGAERVTFRAATNAGAAAGALHHVASGGELSRFMLALCAVLADRQATPSMIFDEIDAGVGGAVAHACGVRLARLARNAQVLVVTHHPQVAALAAHHYRIAKSVQCGTTRTTAEPLPPGARREEIARMLSGAEITEEARAAADSLLAAVSAPTCGRETSGAWQRATP